MVGYDNDSLEWHLQVELRYHFQIPFWVKDVGLSLRLSLDLCLGLGILFDSVLL